MQALSECDKFTSLINPASWHIEMETNRKKLLWKTLFDKEIEYHGDNKCIIPSLFEAYKRHYPVQATQSNLKFKKSLEMEENIH